MNTPTSPSLPCSPPQRLIVVGAGMAGIRLAHTCLQDNSSSIQSIIILEANDYIGGRISCTKFQGYTVERGANWISGLDTVYQNPVWTLAQAIDLQGQYSNRDTPQAILALDSTTGMNVTQDYLETLQQFQEIHQDAMELCVQQNICPAQDVDVQSLLQQCGWKPSKELSRIQQTVQYNALEVWVADRLDKLSAAHDLRPNANDVDLGKEEVFVEDPRGYNSILNTMVNDIQAKGGNIHLNMQVETIQYDTPGNVKVTAKNVLTGKVVEYVADAVVCTVSIGVLQQNKIHFIPPLPDWKKRAIQEIGMFCFAKVYAQFDESFRPDKDQLAICSDRKGHYPFWMKYKNSNDNLYMCFLGGKEAERVESLTQEEIKNEIETHLRYAFGKMLGSVDPSIFRPTAVSVTDWSKNPKFCGSYSYFPVHAFANVPEVDLTCGLTGTDDREGPKTLYFAGEAFDDKFNGWVQGAYRSGERVAKTILGKDGIQQ